jgi:hypothetical protein
VGATVEQGADLAVRVAQQDDGPQRHSASRMLPVILAIQFEQVERIQEHASNSWR